VFVTTPGGTSATSPPDRFTYRVPIPVVTALSPTTGPPAGGTVVVVTGTSLTGSTKVRFGPVAATSFTVVSDSEITAVAPPQAAGSRYVFVTTPGGTSATSPADKFTYH
jgi:hypothetical protein